MSSEREGRRNGEEERKGWQYMIAPNSDASVVLDVVRPLFSTSPLFSLESESVNVDESVLYTYLLAASQKYNNNPYHNLQHAANVSLFVSNMLIECCTGMDPLVCFALLVSAFVHDVDHGGRTNSYEINSRSRLAKIYNDQSVLEHHHCSTAFFILDSPGCDFLSRLSFDRRALFRKAVIGNILATDMAVHDQIVATCREREGAGGFHFEAAGDVATSVADQLLLSRILIHAADLSTPVRTFEACKNWASLIAQEFNAQVSVCVYNYIYIYGCV